MSAMTPADLAAIEARSKAAERSGGDSCGLCLALIAEIRRLRAVVDHLRDFRDYRGPDVQGAWSELAKHLGEIDGTPPAQD